MYIIVYIYVCVCVFFLVDKCMVLSVDSHDFHNMIAVYVGTV